MSDDRWLRDALRAAAATGRPADGARAAGALARASRRRRQRVTAVSCSAAVAVVVATAAVSGGSGTTGLRPVSPVSDSPSPSPSPAETSPPAPTPTPAVTREAPPATSAPPATTAPAPPPAPSTPARPLAVDVFFLVDSTATMRPHADAVERAVGQIAARLGERAWLHWGYGTFDDFEPYEFGDEVDRVYRRLSPLRYRPDPFPEITYGGGGDDDEAHTVGLLGALGDPDGTPGSRPEPAGFRADRASYVVLLTDGRVKQGPEYPEIAETVRRLRAAGVAVAGLQLLGDRDVVGSRQDLDLLAARTGAVAAGPVDCDGDGRHGAGDLAAGAPLVCAYESGATEFRSFADALLAAATAGGAPNS